MHAPRKTQLSGVYVLTHSVLRKSKKLFAFGIYKLAPCEVSAVERHNEHFRGRDVSRKRYVLSVAHK